MEGSTSYANYANSPKSPPERQSCRKSLNPQNRAGRNHRARDFIGGRLLGNKAPNGTGLWVARLVAAPILAVSLAGIAWSQEFDPFEAPPSARQPATAATLRHERIWPTRRGAPRRPAFHSAARCKRRIARRTPGGPAKSSWSRRNKGTSPHATAKPVTQHRMRAGPRNSHVTHAAWQEEKPSRATTTSPRQNVARSGPKAKWSKANGPKASWAARWN